MSWFKSEHHYDECRRRRCAEPLCIAYKKGYGDGFGIGYEQGHDEGRAQGQREGFAAGQAAPRNTPASEADEYCA